MDITIAKSVYIRIQPNYFNCVSPVELPRQNYVTHPDISQLSPSRRYPNTRLSSPQTPMINLKMAKNFGILLCSVIYLIRAQLYGLRHIRRSEFLGEIKSTNSFNFANNKILSPYSQEERLETE